MRLENEPRKKQDEKYMSDLTLSFSVYFNFPHSATKYICNLPHPKRIVLKLKIILWSLKFPNSTDLLNNYGTQYALFFFQLLYKYTS